eukprot:TRINITY_DN5446_c0_g10_i1.p1 TRINITY_DN5446_c0_g10~~TRINITY_DN5446_c0_g10_i1.p1  ORF type:complete len:137 (+),score=6.57 TRINITY_DN5446_c0_g10_i1:77-487(+)
MCIRDSLWPNTPFNNQQVRNIFYSINALEYYDRPNYPYIRCQLLSMLQAEREKETVVNSISNQIAVGGKRKLKRVTGGGERGQEECERDCPVYAYKVSNRCNGEKEVSVIALPITKDLFKVIIDEEYYKILYGNPN